MEKEQNTTPVSIYCDEQGNPEGIRVTGCGMDFMIKLHDELDGREVEYAEAEKYSLPDEMMARLYGIYRKEINSLMVAAGGDPLDNWYWTSTPASEMFGASDVNGQLIYYGTYGSLYSGSRVSSYAVRVARAL